MFEVGPGLSRFKTAAWFNSDTNTIVFFTIVCIAVFFTLETPLQANEYGSLRISSTLSNPDLAVTPAPAMVPDSAGALSAVDSEQVRPTSVLIEPVLLSGDAPIADAVVVEKIVPVEPVIPAQPAVNATPEVTEKITTVNTTSSVVKTNAVDQAPPAQKKVEQAKVEQAATVPGPIEPGPIEAAAEPLVEIPNITPAAVSQPVVSHLENQPKIEANLITPQTTLNPTSGKFKFNVVTDNMIDSLNSIIPQNTAANAMSLETFHLMIAAAVTNHPEMRAVVEQTKVAGFASSEAFGAYLPQITGSVDAGTRTSRSSTSSDFLPKGDGVDAALSVKQLLYDFGATGASYDSAKYREQASLERMATKRSELSFRAISAYIELLRARLLYRLAQENFNSRLSILNMVKERYELGGGNKVDVIRAEARLTDASSIKISAGISLQLAEAGYKEMFLQEPDETPLPQDVSIELANQSIDELSKRFGAVRETELGLKSLRSDAKAAESRMLPTLNFEVNGARRSQETYYGEYSETSAHLVMRYNLFTGGADSARKEQAVHRAEQMQQDLDNLILQVKKSIVQSTTQVNEAEGLVRVRREGVLGASQSLLAVKEHFSYRRGTLLDLLRSQEELYIAGRDYISSLMDRSIARYRLLHLTAALETMIPDLKSQ